MRSILALILLGVVTVLSGANEPLSGGNAPSVFVSPLTEAQREQILALDFSEQLAQTTASPMYLGNVSAYEHVDPKWTGGLTFDGTNIPNANLSAVYVGNFSDRFGRLPDDATELLPDLQTAEGFDAFMALSKVEQFKKCAYLVNRVTGHPYSTFKRHWNPGGLSVQAFAPGDNIWGGPGGISAYDESQFDSRYRYWVYGSEVGTLSVEDVYAIKSGSEAKLIKPDKPSVE
ncbi:MAG: hypothetical protein M3R04_02505 [bacterium]|nr:hypothetical protein [bacterium]